MARLATIAPFGFVDFDPPIHLKAYQRLGCRTLQFYRNELNPPQLSDVLRVAEDLGMPFDSIHGVYGGRYDPSSPIESIRKDAVETYRREGELALRLGGPKVVVHPGPPAEQVAQITGESIASRVAPFRHTLDQLAAIGEAMGVTYLIENIPANYHLGADAPMLAEMVRAVNHPRIRMCFDTGHAHLTTGAVASLQACLDVIDYVHVNDNRGDLDSHLIPGDGSVPWDDIGVRLATLRPDLPVMLELFQPHVEIDRRREQGLVEQLRRWLALS